MSDRSPDAPPLRLAQMQAVHPLAADSPSPASTRELDFASCSIELLAELEASLMSSQSALLSRNVSAIERETQEQWRLQGSLADLWARRLASMQKADSASSASPRLRPLLPPKLRAAQLRVWQLARVQLALLGRAQRWLQVVSHLMKGPSAGYGPPAGINSFLTSASWPPANKRRKGPSCRA
jgi:hypothetical protein